jgi:ATP-binding protein involved in chromosome partitioning
LGSRFRVTVDKPPQSEELLPEVRHRIVIMSGKGGVGKSLVSSYLAVALAKRGYRVGVLDIDFHGPSVPIFLGLEGRKPSVSLDGIEPVEGPLGVRVMSLGFLTDDETPIIWRGPLKTGAIVQLLTQVRWDEQDFLIIDLPPGTGDEPLTVAQRVRVDGAIIVTTPSKVVGRVVVRAVNFARHVGLKVLGLVENMSYFYCPESGRVYSIFGDSTSDYISQKYGIPIIAKIPIDPELPGYVSRGLIYILEKPDTPLAEAFEGIATFIENWVNQVNPSISSETH